MHKTKCKSLIYIYVVVSHHLPHQFLGGILLPSLDANMDSIFYGYLNVET